jgi:hypothetical protein
MKSTIKNLFHKPLFAGLLTLSLPITAAEKHVHGEATLFVAVEGQQTLIELESPADNILGFEHAPSTDKQKQLLKTQLGKLATYSNLITFSNSECTQKEHHIDSPFSAKAEQENHDHEKHDDHDHEKHDDHDHAKHDDHDHGKHDEHDHAKHDDHDHGKHDEHDHAKHDDHDHGKHDEHGETHSDFHVSYTLECGTHNKQTINIEAFKNFPGFEKIDVNWVLDGDQGSKKASPKNTRIVIK